MPSKWISLKNFEREYIDDEEEVRVLDRIIALGASGDLEVKAGLWVKTHYEEIKATSLEACLTTIYQLTDEEKVFVRDIYDPTSKLQHIRIPRPKSAAGGTFQHESSSRKPLSWSQLERYCPGTELCASPLIED